MQSRIANDIGGVQAVVTSTATSILANGATATAALIAMFLLDWRLALLSVVLLPVFLVVVRRVGRERRAVTTLRQRKLDEMTTLVEESLSVSGVLLGRTMGRDRSLIARFSGQSGELADLEVRQRTAGQWVIAALQIGFAITPALVYWIAGQSSTRSRSDARRVHDDPGAGLLAGRAAAVHGPDAPQHARSVRADLRLP